MKYFSSLILVMIFMTIIGCDNVTNSVVGNDLSSVKPSVMLPEYIYYYPGGANGGYGCPVIFFIKNSGDQLRHTVSGGIVTKIDVISEQRINVTMNYLSQSYSFDATITPIKYTDFGQATVNNPFDGFYAIGPYINNPVYTIYCFKESVGKIRIINLLAGSDVTYEATVQNQRVFISDNHRIILNQIAPMPLSGVYNYVIGDSANYSNYEPVVEVLGQYYNNIVQ